MQLGKRVFTNAVSLFNKLDELGGEARDYLMERYRPLEKIEEIRKKFDRFTTREEDVENTSEAKQSAPATTEMAEEKEPLEPLGNIAAAAQIYGRRSCPWTGRASSLLEKNNIVFDYIELDDIENSRFETRLVGETKQNTVPYVFLRGEFIGGFNALNEVERLGQLEIKTIELSGRNSANPRLKNILIAERPNTDEVVPAENIEVPAPSPSNHE